jgi:hypothetical protein
MPMPVPPGDGLVCVSYSFRCTKGDTACTAEEQASGALRTAYIVNTRQTCAEMQNMGQVYMNVVCCGSNDCNAPGATAGATGSGSVPCKGVLNNVCAGGMYCYAEGTPNVACVRQGMLGAGNPLGAGGGGAGGTCDAATIMGLTQATDDAATQATMQNMMMTNPGCGNCMMGCMTGSADMVGCIMGCVASPADAACDMPTLISIVQGAGGTDPTTAMTNLMVTKPKCSACMMACGTAPAADQQGCMMGCVTGPGPQNAAMPTIPGCEEGGRTLKDQKAKADQAAKAAGCDPFILVRS